MKVKLDENMPRSANQVLIAAGHDVDTVVEENRAGAIDPQVVAAVGRLLITLDRGLGDIRASTRRAVTPGSSCCDQRTSRSRPVVAALAELIAGHDWTTLTGTIAIAQRGLLRIRRPQ